MGYPQGLLSTRAVIKPGEYAILPPQGLVNNVIPGFEKCRTSILASPKYGASFVQYIVTVEAGGCSTIKMGGDGKVETFLYSLDGDITVKSNEKLYELKTGGYIYTPADMGLTFSNNSNKTTTILLYKQVYIPLEGHSPWLVVGNVADLEVKIYDNMSNVTLIDFLPTDIAFDMNMHILAFEPGGSHPFIETHVQEHGAYIYSGEGVYRLGNEWIPVQKEDFIWFGPYTPQAVYASGREPLAYIYSKDCNRDVEL